MEKADTEIIYWSEDNSNGNRQLSPLPSFPLPFLWKESHIHKLENPAGLLQDCTNSNSLKFSNRNCFRHSLI